MTKDNVVDFEKRRQLFAEIIEALRADAQELGHPIPETVTDAELAEHIRKWLRKARAER